MSQEQRTYSQHPVPQHVLGVEFKLIGDMTIRQFGYAAGGLVLAYLIYSSILPFIFKIPLAIIVAILGASLAFLPVNERPMDQYLTNFLFAIASPTERVWVKDKANLDIFYENLAPVTVDLPTPIPKDRRNLREYVGKIKTDKSRSTFDLREAEYLKSLEAEFESSILNPATETAERGSIVGPIPTFRPERVEVRPTPTLASEFNFTNQELISIPTISRAKKFVTTIKNIRPGRKLHSMPTIEGEIVMPVAGEIVLHPEEERKWETEDLMQKAQTTLTTLDEKMEQLKKAPEPKEPRGAPQSPKVVAAPAEKRAAVIPVALDKKPEEERAKIIANQRALADEELAKLRKQNEDLFLQINRERKRREEAERTTEESAQSQEKIHYLQEQNEQLTKEIKKTEEEAKKALNESAASKAEKENSLRILKEQQRRLEALSQEKAESIDEIVRLQKDMQSIRSQMQKTVQESVLSAPRMTPTGSGAPPAKAPSKVIPFVRDIPNVINGYVRDRNSTLLKNAVIIIKDQNDDVVRALKTNDLGQFAITTPLPNGTYQIEPSAPNNSFDIITADLGGTVLEPMEFLGH